MMNDKYTCQITMLLRLVLLLAGILSLVVSGGCRHHLTGDSPGSRLMRGAGESSDQQDETRRESLVSVEPADDVAEALPPPGDSASAVPSDQVADLPISGISFPIDAMVGQVNGKAIYARTVFEPIEPQLSALGSQLVPSEFVKRAEDLIGSRLYQIVADALILGEAQRSLTDMEQVALKEMLRRKREELLRLHGQGSLLLAQKNIKDQTGFTIEETLEQFRQSEVVKRHLQKKILPKINVTRRDIERFYRDHYDQFNPEMSRRIRLIRVDSQAQVEHATELLKTGEPFEQVAALEMNKFHSDEGGFMTEATGDAVFGKDELNEAMKQLDSGEYSPPIELDDDFWIIYVEKLERPGGISLQDAQLMIKEKLRNQQYRDLSNRYRKKLFEEGSYNPIDQMTERLVQIAVSRYAAK